MSNLKRSILFQMISIFSFFLLGGIPDIEASSLFRKTGAGNEKETNVQVIRNIRYGEQTKVAKKDSSSDRTLDLYLPYNKGEKLPVFVFIHGGGFSGGDKKGTEAFCSKISGQGFAVVSINYYLTLKHEKTAGVSCSAYMVGGIPENGFHPLLQEAIKNASGDTQLALLWIKNNEKNYPFDLSSITLSGGSAGAMTALYTAYISDQKILPIGAVVNFWGGLEKPKLISNEAPPLLTYHGDQDQLIHIDFAYALQNRMEETANEKSELHILKGKGHAVYNLITRNKVAEIVAFLETTIQKQK
jgi:acetyl esterase/lipase